MILVAIRLPGLEVEPTNPAWLINGFARGILDDLLAVELTTKNLLTQPHLTGPRPFAGTLLFPVEDVERAAAIVWGVLRRNHIGCWATIFRFDAEELIWRSIYPRRGIGLLNFTKAAESEAMILKCKTAITLWQEALKLAGQ